MARRKKAHRAWVISDPTYKSRLVTLLINKVLQEGKKRLSQKIVYTSLTLIAFKIKENPLLVLEKVVRNVLPQIEVKSR
jgi:small subunit ribosomal protein S7